MLKWFNSSQRARAKFIFVESYENYEFKLILNDSYCHLSTHTHTHTYSYVVLFFLILFFGAVHLALIHALRPAMADKEDVAFKYQATTQNTGHKTSSDTICSNPNSLFTPLSLSLSLSLTPLSLMTRLSVSLSPSSSWPAGLNILNFLSPTTPATILCAPNPFLPGQNQLSFLEGEKWPKWNSGDNRNGKICFLRINLLPFPL